MTENNQLEPAFNFSIQDTIPGTGNAELVNDLLAPETATASPKEAEEIKPETVEPVKPKADKPENKEPVKDVSIQDFLAGGDEEEEEIEDKPSSKKEPVKSFEDEEENNNSESQFSSLAKDLLQLGVFTAEEGENFEVNSPEEFLEKFNNEKQKGANQIIQNFLGQFGEDYQKAFQAIYVNGVDPKEYFSTYNNIVNFSELDITKEANQEKVIRQALADQEFDQEDIEAEIERLKNYGDLESTATRHHKVLVKKEASKLQQLEQQAQLEQEQKRAYRNQYIQNVTSVLQEKVKAKDFDGIPLNPKLAEEVQDFLITDRYRLPSGETITSFDKAILDLKDPANHAKKVKVALLLKVLEKDPTLSTIQKAGITKKTDSLFSQTIKHSSKPTQSASNKPTSWFQ